MKNKIRIDRGIDYGEGIEQKGRVRSTGMGLRIAEQGQRMAVII
jgi:hypothetical protein